MGKIQTKPEDLEYFRREMADVAPISHDLVPPELKKPAPIPFQTYKDEQAVVQESVSHSLDEIAMESGEELFFQRPGLRLSTVKKLKRGQFSVAAELDLHGLVVKDAKQAITLFLAECRQDQKHCVRIIHGKGRRSPQGLPVLKNKVNLWLQHRDEVLAFCSARPVDGGTGAIYVLLRKLIS